jgi:multidrug efflux pump subunit AcrB
VSTPHDRVRAEREQTRREALRLKMTRRPLGGAGRIAKAFLESKLTLLVVFSLLLGAFAVLVTPREEEPQIKVPMIDVMLGLPGATAREVERRLTAPVEKAIAEIANVEYVYSTTQPSGGMVIVRFKVGTDPDQAVVRVHAKLAELAPTLPPGAMPPVVAPRGIDDVPVLAYTLWSSEATPLQLRTIAEELRVELTKHPRVAQVTVLGGQRRAVRVSFDRERLASHHISLLQAYQALAGLNWRLPAGSFAAANVEADVEVGSYFRDAGQVGSAVVAVYGGNPVHLREVATVTDGPDEAADYVWMTARNQRRGARSGLGRCDRAAPGTHAARQRDRHQDP